MKKNQKLLVLEGKEAKEDQRLGLRIDRIKAKNAVSSSGAKILHDSGGRFIIIEVTGEAEKVLIKSLPGVQLVPVDSDMSVTIKDLDSNESLFLEALKIRTSKSYRDAKKRRKAGETPEEKDLLSASCVREEY